MGLTVLIGRKIGENRQAEAGQILLCGAFFMYTLQKEKRQVA